MLTFDSQDLMASPYIVRYVKHDLWPDRNLTRENLAYEQGTVVTNTQYGEKIFEVAGKITGTSQDNLEANVDTFKELMSRKGKNLDIGYGGSTRRYIAYADDVKVDRDFYHLLHAPFSLKFVVPKGVGINPSQVTDTNLDITDASYNNTITIVGTAEPKPVITITVDSETDLTVLELTANGDKITITQGFTAADVLVIDCENKKVTLNGSEIAYDGIFPSFIIGSNSYTIDATSTAHQYDLSIAYYKTYL